MGSSALAPLHRRRRVAGPGSGAEWCARRRWSRGGPGEPHALAVAVVVVEVHRVEGDRTPAAWVEVPTGVPPSWRTWLAGGPGNTRLPAPAPVPEVQGRSS